MHLPQKDRNRAAAAFDRQKIEQLQQAMVAWVGARSMNQAAFARQFIDSPRDEAATEKLRSGAVSAASATTYTNGLFV